MTVKISIAAGYTTLAYLRTLPVRALQIDRGLVTDMLDDPTDRTV